MYKFFIFLGSKLCVISRKLQVLFKIFKSNMYIKYLWVCFRSVPFRRVTPTLEKAQNKCLPTIYVK